MIDAVLFGFVAAAFLGTADFLARFTSLRLGPAAAFTYVVVIGSLVMTAFVSVSGAKLTFTTTGLMLSALHGLSVAGMSLMLYAALARGPISLAVPIVAAHPVLVLFYEFAVGSLYLSLQQGLAAGLVILGVVAASLLSLNHIKDQGEEKNTHSNTRSSTGGTLLLALGACFAYAFLIISGQSAAAEIGQVGAAWVGRLTSALVLLLALGGGLFRLPKPGKSLMPLVVQGVLDTLGYIALLAGGLTAFPGMTAVIGSTFGFVTIILARLFISERLGTIQWIAIALSFAGIAWLVGSS